MIGRIQGTVVKVGAGYCIVGDAIGYKIALAQETLASLREGSSAALWTHLAVREDALDLYGFASESDLRFFELLLTVPGVGPKSALGILNVASADTLRSAIARGNDAYLTNVSGIGKKTAQKILLELKDKVGAASDEDNARLKGDEEALEAMRSLGYTAHEARETLKKVPAEISGSRERLREALKILGGA